MCKLFLIPLTLILVLTGTTIAAPAQNQQTEVCANLLAVLPTSPDLYTSKPLGPDTRERFEFRECGALEVLAFERGKLTPTLIVNTQDGYPAYLFQLRTVLAFQCVGGASDHVYVFAFESGKPRLVKKTATKDVITVSLDIAEDIALVSIPAVTYPNRQGKWTERPPIEVLKLHLE